MFQMPLKEIRRKFRTSELFVIAWRSQEQSAQFRRKFGNTSQEALPADGENPFEQTRRQTTDEARTPPGVPAKFTNTDGEVDLRKMTGRQAWQFLASQGLKLPIIRSEK